MTSKEELVAHFSGRLAYETDPSDVHADIDAAKKFILVDVRGQSSWDQGRAQGAVHMHHSEIAERAPKEIPLDMPVVVYCWGPGCNRAHKGALNFALLGCQVKEMIGFKLNQEFPHNQALKDLLFDFELLDKRELLTSGYFNLGRKKLIKLGSGNSG
jgi:rhodanese-related sulfurtransferase